MFAGERLSVGSRSSRGCRLRSSNSEGVGFDASTGDDFELVDDPWTFPGVEEGPGPDRASENPCKSRNLSREAGGGGLTAVIWHNGKVTDLETGEAVAFVATPVHR